LQVLDEKRLHWPQPSPIELMFLEALQYLRRGWTFDDLCESTGVHEEVHQVFFHVFVDYGSSILYCKFVVMPKTQEEAATHMHEMSCDG